MMGPATSSSKGRMLVEFPTDIREATQIRGSLLQSSLNAIQRLGMEERYFELLGPAHAPAIRNLIVGQWSPMSLGVAHYGAIERLGLDPAQARENGRLVAAKVQVGFAGIVFRGLGTAVTPLDALKRVPTFFERLIDGGSVSLELRGPKDVRVDVRGIPIGRFAYVREGWAGMFEATLGLLSYRTFVRNSSPGIDDEVILDVAWV